MGVQPFQVLVIDDHEIVRRGVADLVATDPGFAIVAEAARIEDARRLASALQPDLALLDLQLPDGIGLYTLEHMATHSPDTLSVTLSSFDDRPAILRAASLGARGVRSKRCAARRSW